jgi:predicted small secreted protein
MLRKFLALFLVTSTFALGACNTIEGAGEDVESVGNAIQNTAE